MDFFSPRKLMFKAWNKETRLLMRLNNIECKRGELFKKDHIIVQFTGLLDKNEEEIYEMDVLMIAGEKYVVVWDESGSAWKLASLKNPKSTEPLLPGRVRDASRLWSYFEIENAN